LEYSEALDVGTLLHNLLFSYQKAATDVLGESQEVFYHPTIDILLKIEEDAKLQIITAKSLDEALNNFSIFLKKSGVMNDFIIKKDNNEVYTVTVQKCLWANRIHRMLKPADVICPWALIATAIIQKYKGMRLEETKSTYLENGSETTIRPLKFGFSKEEAIKLATT
jgi:hypothetical protein